MKLGLLNFFPSRCRKYFFGSVETVRGVRQARLGQFVRWERVVWRLKCFFWELKPGVKAGVKAGLKAGLKAGVKAGLKAGLNPGLKAGLKAGLNPGLKAGLKAGLNPGLKAGLKAGLNPGLGRGRARATSDRRGAGWGGAVRLCRRWQRLRRWWRQLAAEAERRLEEREALLWRTVARRGWRGS